jgi:hypothetical protein
MSGTNKEILRRARKRVKPPKNGKGGRPRVNRELVLRLLKSTDSKGVPRYSYAQIARDCGCSKKTVTRIRDEALLSGDLKAETREDTAIGTVEADFEAECVRAMGYSFYEWIIDATPTAGKTNFNFIRECWETIWERCSLVDVRDSDHPLGDQVCQAWLRVFGTDKDRIRYRKKQVRYIFRFLGREDLCNRHLRMNDAQDPRNIRRVPEINSTDFPQKILTCFAHMEREFPTIKGRLGINGEIIVKGRIGGELICWLKVASQIRTGDNRAERELWGIKTGTQGKSYLYMTSANEFQFHVFAKLGKHWDIVWLPKEVREKLYEVYKTTPTGSQLMKGIGLDRFRKEWKIITTQIIGRPLTLHDLRKVSLTWLYSLGVPLEIATQMNVGWDDMNTATRHYVNIRKVLRKSVKANYSRNIPVWFKEGLEDFVSEDAVDRLSETNIQNILEAK